MPIFLWTKAKAKKSNAEIENTATDDRFMTRSAADIFACPLSSRDAPQTNDDSNQEASIDKSEDKAAAVPAAMKPVEHNVQNVPCQNHKMQQYKHSRLKMLRLEVLLP